MLFKLRILHFRLCRKGVKCNPSIHYNTGVRGQDPPPLPLIGNFYTWIYMTLNKFLSNKSVYNTDNIVFMRGSGEGGSSVQSLVKSFENISPPPFSGKNSDSAPVFLNIIKCYRSLSTWLRYWSFERTSTFKTHGRSWHDRLSLKSILK